MATLASPQTQLRIKRQALTAEYIRASEDSPVHNSTPLLIGIREVATALDCSVRHVRRLIDSGRMPKPFRLGALLRWRKAIIEDWIETGCPELRKF